MIERKVITKIKKQADQKIKSVNKINALNHVQILDVSLNQSQSELDQSNQQMETSHNLFQEARNQSGNVYIPNTEPHQIGLSVKKYSKIKKK